MNRKNIFLLFIICLIVYACEDIFEKDMKDYHIKLLAPADNLETVISTQLFWWEELEDVSSVVYNLQIVSPSFDSIGSLLVDTNTTWNKFYYSLTPGSYQWRVRAYNSTSTTDYTTFSLTILSSDDLTNQTVLLKSPSDYDTTNKTTLTFRWDTLYNAEDYRFEIRTPDFNGSVEISITLETDSFVYTLSEGSYEWGVRAQNTTTNTQYFIHSLYIDTTAPYTPVLTSPVNNAVFPDTTVEFKWSRGTQTGSSIKDSLWIYKDSSMSSIKRQTYLFSTNYSDSLGAGVYYWRVRSLDAAGNKSGYSALQKFTVQ